MSSHDVDDAYLVSRAQEGYLEAYEVLVERHTAAVYRVALRLLGNREDAQDITQETFIAAWQGLARFKADSAFSTWLYRIVSRRALNRLTRGRTGVHDDLLDQRPDASPGPADRAVQTGAVDAVTDAVARLPVAQRVVVVLFHLEGLSYSEVATVTASTVPSVRSHLHRARRTLALELETWR